MGHDPDGLVVTTDTLATAQQGWQQFRCRTVTVFALIAASPIAIAVEAGAQTERLTEFVRRNNDDLRA